MTFEELQKECVCYNEYYTGICRMLYNKWSNNYDDCCIENCPLIFLYNKIKETDNIEIDFSDPSICF